MSNKIINKIEKLIPLKWRWILSHVGFRRYFANTGWLFFGQIFSLVISFFIGAWLARYLGPKNYGVINYAVAFVGIFGFIAPLGIDSLLLRELVKYPEKRDELLGTSFLLKIIGGMLAFSVVVFSIFVFKISTFNKILVCIYAVSLIMQSFNVISSFFQAKVQSKNIVKVQLVAMFVSAILKIIFIFSGFGLIWLMVIFTLDGVWQAIGFLFAYWKNDFKICYWSFNSEIARKFLKGSWLLMLSAGTSFILLKIDQVMIGRFMGEYEVGIYAAAAKFAEIWYFVPNIICGSLFPAIINAKKNNIEIYKKRLNSLYLLLLTIAVIIAVPTTLLSHWTILVLFGKAYLASVSVLQIYIWSGVGLFLGSGIYQYLMAENRLKIIFVTSFFAMLVNIVLNLILIPKIGLNGAALATLISYFVVPITIFIKDNYFKSEEII